MPLVKHDEPVKTFFANSADPAFSKRVGFRGMHRGCDDLERFSFENGVEDSRVLAVAIAQQEVRRITRLLQLPHEVPCLLINPRSGRMRRDACEMNATRADLNEKEAVQSLQAQRLNREKVTRQELVTVVFQKRAPRGCSTVAFWGGRNAVTAQDVTDGRFANRHGQFFQLPGQLTPTPTVFACQL